MCGEHCMKGGKAHGNKGSSPHVRGALNRYYLLDPSSGIIPACAGSTKSSSSFDKVAKDHPRMCGEHR